jgi:sporulation protein YlmC with PRC-barrel domain
VNPAVLEGKKVVGSEGYVLGEVDGVNVNSNNWQANTFNVNLSDEATAELGFKKPFLSKITVCLPTQLIKTVGDIISLKEPIRNLEEITERGVVASPALLKGKKVVSAKGVVIGEIEGFDVDIELSSWHVTGLEVGLTDGAATELGFKRPFLSKVVIIIPTGIVSLVGNFVTLDEDIENLESLVECIKSCQKKD